jgi:Flp pilus assembly pilin Flp
MIWSKNEKGQGTVEYGLLIVLIAITLILVLALLGSQISNFYSEIVSSWPP